MVFDAKLRGTLGLTASGIKFKWFVKIVKYLNQLFCGPTNQWLECKRPKIYGSSQLRNKPENKAFFGFFFGFFLKWQGPLVYVILSKIICTTPFPECEKYRTYSVSAYHQDSRWRWCVRCGRGNSALCSMPEHISRHSSDSLLWSFLLLPMHWRSGSQRGYARPQGAKSKCEWLSKNGEEL